MGISIFGVQAGTAALNLESLRQKVHAALSNADSQSALHLIHDARKVPGLKPAEDIELTLLEAESQDDLRKAQDLLEALLAREDLSRRTRGRTQKTLGLRFYLGEDFTRALPHLESAWQDLDKKSVDAQEAAYFAGLCAMEARQYSRAQNNFLRVGNRDPVLGVWALIGAAEVSLKQDRPKEALAAFEEISLAEPAGPYQAFLLSRQAACLEKLGRGPESVMLLNRIRSEFPDSLSALEAQEQLRRIPAKPGDVFILQTGAFSNSAKAHGLADKLSAAGYRSKVVDRGRSAKVRYKVWSGQYASRPEAERVARRMQEKFKISSYIFQGRE